MAPSSRVPAGRKPKSYKADGTPKKRWSAQERAARGHAKRTGGGKRSYERDDKRPYGRDDRGRDERRPHDRDERRSYGRDDRRSGRDDRRGYDRDDKRPYGREGRGRDERRSYGRDDRGRDESRSFGRDDRRSFGRDDKPSYGRKPYGKRDDRREDRYSDRPRKSAWGRDDERAYEERSRGFKGRKSYGRDDRRDDRFEQRRPQHDGERRGNRYDDHRDDRRDNRGDERRHGRFNDRRDDRPSTRSFDREDRRSHGRADHRSHDRHDDRRDRRHDRGGWDEDFQASPTQDSMEWAEAEAVEVDTSTVSGENGFARLGVPDELVAVLDSKGITDPFPIQQASIPDALAGYDVLGRGRTGSGKTLGFSLPLLARLSGTVTPDGQKRRPQAVILEPTRELAMQVADVLSPLARALGMRSLLVAGGMSYDPQRKALSRGVDVIIATPGRLIDLMEQGAADLSDVRVSVLDEADEMADMGFLPEVTRILDDTPTDGQRMLFSATLDKGVDGLVRRYMTDPKVHEVDSSQASVTTMEHLLVLVKPEHKARMTAEIANRDGKTIVFARTQKGVDRIAGQLRDAGVMAGGLHGGLTQGARARVMKAFKDGTVPVLVATDVAARGIHVDDVGLVLQVDPPGDARDYTHRAGRTARAGTDGVVVTLVLPQQRRSMTRLVRDAGVDARPEPAGLDEEWLHRATGARKPSADPIENAEYEALIAPQQGGGRRGGRRPYRGGGKGHGRGRGGNRGYRGRD